MNQKAPMVKKLIQLAKYDLRVRAELVKENALTKFGYHPVMKKVHDENLLFLTSFLSAYGWPKPSECGNEAFEAAWFIAIHAIDHRQQMKDALVSVKKLLDDGEDVAYQYASLYDRIECFEGRIQRYGTQLAPSKNGWQPVGLSDLRQADKYSAKIGLPSIAETILEFNNSNEPGVVENTEEAEEDEAKFNKWLKRSEWRA